MLLMSNDFKDKLADSTVAELQQLSVEIVKAIEERKYKEINDARIQVRQIAESLGITLEELMAEPEKPARQNKKAKIKYRNPESENETWTGRGKQPRWLTQALESGAKLEDFAV